MRRILAVVDPRVVPSPTTVRRETRVAIPLEYVDDDPAVAPKQHVQPRDLELDAHFRVALLSKQVVQRVGIDVIEEDELVAGNVDSFPFQRHEDRLGQRVIADAGFVVRLIVGIGRWKLLDHCYYNGIQDEL